MLVQMILGDHENSENSLKRKSPNTLPAAQKREGREPEASDATRSGMENASLNTGANCKRYVCNVLHNVMQFWTRGLFIHKTYINIYEKYSLSYRLGDKKRRPKR
jgi:hypothetical protein